MKQIITLCAAIAVNLSCFGQIPTANLVAYYPFNGNALDESANSNDATLNGPSLATDRFGNQNSAYDFDGVDDLMTIAHDNSINFDGFTESYTFSFWVNSATPKLTDQPFRLFEKRITGLGNEEYPVIIGGVTGTNDYSSQYVVYDGTPPSTNFTSPGAEWDGDWHHMVFMVDNAAWQLKIYIDAVLIGFIPLDLSSSTANTADLIIGSNYDNQIFYHGLIDDIRLYESALTECEIYALYLEDMPNLNTTESIAICEGDSYTFPDGTITNNITADMAYTSYFPSTVNGCDSASIETSIAVTLVDETVTVGGLGMTITSNVSSGASYQWLDCDNNLSPIIGQTFQSYTATVNGNYALQITQSGCMDTSECTVINSAGLDEITASVAIYPNPSEDLITIKTSSELIGANYSVFDLSGKEIFNATIESTNEVLSMAQFGAGVYTILIGESGIRKRVVIQ